MSELMSAIKEDLTSRRMLPLLIVALGLLAGAVAYAALGGKTSPSVASTRPPASVPTVPGPSVSNAPANTNAAVAETTNGSKLQHRGHVHNPFKPLPGSSEAEGAKAGTTTGQEGSSTSSGSESSGAPTESTPSGGSEAPQHGEELATQTVYEVSAKLQKLSSTGKPEGKPLALQEMKPLHSLPSDKRAMFAYAGVASGGNGALLLLLSPAIVHGPAHCLPGPANCEAIYLKPQQSEELQYLEESGVVVSYELTLAKFEGVEVPASAARTYAARLVKAEGELESKLGLSLPAGVRYSEETGLLLGVQEAIRAKSK